MPYVTSVERVLERQRREEGFVKGLAEAVSVALEAKFGTAGRKLVRKIRTIKDVDRLKELARVLTAAEKLDDVGHLLAKGG